MEIGENAHPSLTVDASRLASALKGDTAEQSAVPVLSCWVEMAPAITGATRTSIYGAIREKKLTARKVGRRTIIEIAELQRWISTFPTKGREPEAVAA
jgi:hypothetical protein